LPAGATETGGWSVFQAPEHETWLPISFFIQLAAALDEAHVHYVTASEISGHTEPAACQGTVATPTAETGNLCVYEEFTFNLELAQIHTLSSNPILSPARGADTAGAYLDLKFSSAAPRFGDGTWAVTG
jgi:hypothetical protein